MKAVSRTHRTIKQTKIVVSTTQKVMTVVFATVMIGLITYMSVNFGM